MADRWVRTRCDCLELELDSELFIKNLRLSSRLWSASAALLACDSEKQQQQKARQFAQGQTAVVMIPVALRADGQSHRRELLLNSESGRQQLEKLCQLIRAAGALPLVELRHGGPRAGDYIDTQPLGAPNGPRDPHNRRETRACDADCLKLLIRDYGKAAQQALAAGAALLAVEVRDGNFLQNWLSAAGHPQAVSLKFRAQLLLDVIAEIRANLSGEIPLLINLAMQDFKLPGLTIADALQVAQWSEQAGIDALLLSSGDRGSAPLSRLLRPPGPVSEGRYAAMVAWCKVKVKVPVGLLGGWRSQQAINAALKSDLDFVVLERPYACEPELGRALESGLWRSKCTSRRDCLYTESVLAKDCPSSCALLQPQS